MGFAASQARLMMLTARMSDIELQGQFINQARLQLANTVGALFTITANLEPESETVQLLQARIAAIQSIDKALDLQLRRLDSQREAIQTELDSVKKVVTKNIQSTFKTFA